MSETKKPLEQLEQDYQKAQAETGLDETELTEVLEARGTVSRKIQALLGDEIDTKVLKQKETKQALDERLESEIADLLGSVSREQPRYISLDASDDFQNQMHFLAHEKLHAIFPNNTEAKMKFLDISRKIQTLPKQDQMIVFGTLQRVIEMSAGKMDVFTALIETFKEKGPNRVRNLTDLKLVIKDSSENIKVANEKLDELEKEAGDKAIFHLIYSRNRVVHDMDSLIRRADYLIYTFGRIENDFAYRSYEETYKKQGKGKATKFIQKVISEYKPTLKETEVVELAKAA